MDHQLSLNKLESVNLDKSNRDWFKSYLSNWKQMTRVNGTLLGQMDVEYGVLQGSILGPLLFIKFINALPSNIDNCRLHLYADNMAIVNICTLTC